MPVWIVQRRTLKIRLTITEKGRLLYAAFFLLWIFLYRS
jgi:hypothetical protein